MPELFAATIVHLERLPSRYALIELKAPSSWTHKAGQYANLRFDNDQAHRPYSIASHPRSDGILQFCIQLNDPKLIEFLDQCVLGKTEIGISHAGGRFHNPPLEQDALFIAGGSGITPLKAIIEDRLANGSKAQMTLLYGCADDLSIPYYQELKTLAEQHPDQLTVRFFAEDIIMQRAEAGRPVTYLSSYIKPGVDYLMCGPPTMLEASRKLLQDAGIADQSIHQDRY